MTNKLPVVGQRYRYRNFPKMEATVNSINDEFFFIDNGWRIHISYFWDWFEELTENKVDLEKEKVSEVERALEKLKECVKPINYMNYRTSIDYEELREAAQNLVDVLEADLKVNKIVTSKEEQWLPINCAPKDGSSIIVKENANKRHKIFKAQWFLNKWFSLYENGGNEEVHPEFWLEGSKEEPKIDTKEECVEPVSIWKDGNELKELDKRNAQFLVRMKDGRVIMPILSKIFTGDKKIDKNIKEATTLTDFLNAFEQMQKDIQELKKINLK